MNFLSRLKAYRKPRKIIKLTVFLCVIKKYNILHSFLQKIKKISHRRLPQLGRFNFALSQVVNK